ncbi:MAG: S41 family peptidase [Paludibacter sp.]|nr:S41 family peptidase [Paludibacter sp.]
MKRKNWYIFSLIFFLGLFTTFGYIYIQKQNEYKQISGIRYYNSEDISNLAVLCKVWGYLKYYHPSVIEGKYKWDNELVKMMPKVLKSKDKDDRNKILSEWVSSLGEFKQDTFPKINPDSVKMYPDLDWIKNRKELGALSAQLERIKTAKRPSDKSHFVEFKQGAGNPVFLNEETYPEISYPDASYRLLALFRYWNIIQYYFPYKYLIGENWDNVLIEFAPQFINAKNELEYKFTLLKLVARIHDSHAFLSDKVIEKHKGDNIVPFYVSFIEGKPVITDTLIDISKLKYPLKKVGSFIKGNPVTKDTIIDVSEKNYPLKIGDIILKVNGKPVETIISEKLPYIAGSNLPTKLRNLSLELMRTNAKSIHVTFKRGNDVFSKDLTCYPMHSQYFGILTYKNKALYRVISKEKNIGYLYLGSLTGVTVPDFSNTKGLVIDLRCYPNRIKFDGYLNMTQLYKKPVKFVKFTSTNFQRPGMFKYSEEYYTDVFKEKSTYHFANTGFYKGKIIILVNEMTQSHAEFMAMMYRCSPNAVVIGSTTAGADGNVSWIPLPGNMQTMITGLGVYYPDGRETQRVGIVPDIEVKPTIQGIREGRDEVLERAIEFITKKN